MKILSLQTTSIFVIGRHEPCVKYGFSLDEKKGEKKYPHRTWSCHVGPVGLVSCFSKMNRSKRCECRAFLSTWNEANRMQFTCVLNKHLVFPAQNRRVFYYSIHKDLSMRTTFNGLPGLTHKTASHSYERILSRVPMIITSYKIHDWRKPTIFKKNCQTGHRIPIPQDLSHATGTSLWKSHIELQTVMQLCCGWRVGNGNSVIIEIDQRSQDALNMVQSNQTQPRLVEGFVKVLSFENPLTCPVWKISAFWPGPTILANFPSSAYVPWLAWSCQDPSSARCVHWWLAISCWLRTNSKTFLFIVLIHMSICADFHSRIRHWDIRLRDFLVVPSNIAPPNGSKRVSTLTFLWVVVNF